jgi:hypothetical protein
MSKKMQIILVGLMVVAILGGCRKTESDQLPISVEVEKSAADLLADHMANTEADIKAVMVIDDEEVEIGDLSNLIEVLDYGQWVEMDPEEAVAVLTVFVGGDELSFFEGGRVRLWTGKQDAWFTIPKSVLDKLKGIWSAASLSEAEQSVYDEAWMWDQYFYETITSLGNAESFSANDLSEIDNLVEYVWIRYSHGFESEEAMGLAHSSETSHYYLFPRELAYKEAAKYYDFDISGADLANAHSYLPEEDAFEVNYVAPREAGQVSGKNSWMIYYGGAEALGDHRYEVRMISYEDRAATVIARESVYVVRFDQEGKLLFESGQRRMPQYDLSDFTMAIEPIDVLNDRLDQYGRMIGETEEEIFFHRSDEPPRVLGMTKGENAVVRDIDLGLDQDEQVLVIRQKADQGFVVCTNSRVHSYSQTWMPDQVMDLPAFLIDKIEAETEWEDFAIAKIFTGYDISDDLKRIVYGDHEGLKVFSLGEDEPVVDLLEEAEAYPESELSPLSVYWGPRFVDQGRKVFMTRSGYEGNRGVALYDFQTGQMSRFDHGWFAGARDIQPNLGLLIPNESVWDQETGQETSDHYYLNFKTGRLETLAFKPESPMGDLPDSGDHYHGQKDLAILVKEVGTAATDRNTLVQRIDLATGDLVAQTEIPAFWIRIAGVDQDGNVYLHYRYNQESQGFGVIRAGE